MISVERLFVSYFSSLTFRLYSNHVHLIPFTLPPSLFIRSSSGPAFEFGSRLTINLMYF